MRSRSICLTWLLGANQGLPRIARTLAMPQSSSTRAMFLVPTTNELTMSNTMRARTTEWTLTCPKLSQPHVAFFAACRRRHGPIRYVPQTTAWPQPVVHHS